jgi:hypothetical protein
MIPVENSAPGVPSWSVGPSASTDTAVIFPSGAIKQISFPSALHRGAAPPAVDTADRLLGSGNACTVISGRRDSFVS